MILIRIIAFYLISICSLKASLHFEKYLIEDKVYAGVEKYCFEFKFKNIGKNCVKIINVDSSCGCTVAKPNKSDYNPNENGVVSGIFKIGDRVGIQEKQITIFTDNPSDSKIVLSIRITIPKLINIKPTLTFWREKSEISAKEVVVEVDDSLKIVSAESDSQDFKVSLSPDPENKNIYKMSVTPVSTAEPKRAIIKLKAQKSDNTEKTYYIHALIK